MRNPVRNEGDAFRLVWFTLGYFVVIAVAAKLDRWLGLGAFLVETAGVIWWLSRDRPAPAGAPALEAPPAHALGEHRILVVANETVGGASLLAELHRRAEGARVEVLVVAPALNSPVRHWTSDEDPARRAAQERLDASLSAMRDAGITVRGEIGADDPLLAIEDALRTFAPDEIVVSTHPEGRSNWLERGVVEAARERFAVPVTHVVVDPVTTA